MEYSYVVGFADKKHDLLNLHEEKHLFYQTHEKNGKVYFACYHKIVPEEYGQQSSCPARCNIDTTSRVCQRNGSPHTDHANHEVIFRDLKSLNSMKDACRYLQQNFPFSAHRIPIKEIFIHEMAK